MNWKRLWNRLTGNVNRQQAELDEELAFHAQMRERELAAGGISEESAREEARRSLGNLTLVREQVREAWSFAWFTDAVQDCRYGARALAAQPAFTAAAVVALVLGIGVNAVLFNVYNALALAPYAIRDAAQTVQIWGDRGRSWNGFSWPEYRYLREHTNTLSGMIATTNAAIRVARRSGETPWNGEAAAVSENFFEVIGTGFTYGRGFSPDAGRAVNPAAEIVLHHDTWVTRFGSDPRILGQWLEVNGQQLQVVGVAAAGFSGPGPVGPHAWVPGPWRDIFEPDSKTYNSTDHCCVAVIGRLKQGSSRAQVQAELGAVSAQFQSQLGREVRGVRVTTPTVLASPKAQTQALPLFLALAVTAALVLLLACANVANLQIARAVARRGEISVRLALGAGRGRILRQMLVESLLLAGVAGIISSAISSWAPSRIVEFIANEARGVALRFDNDFRVISFIAAVTLLAAVISGMAPAWASVRGAVMQGLREGGRGATSRGRLRKFLLASQVALSAVLVSGTALMVRVADHARHIDPGFSHDNVILVELGLNSSGVAEDQARSLVAELQERVGALPGVEAVAHSIAVPLGNTNMNWGIRDARGVQLSIAVDRVSANFPETLRIPLLAGRGFSKDDEARRELAIVNEAAAERLWPGENPLGKPIQPGSNTIVAGVISNIATRRGQIGSAAQPHVWLAVPAERDSRLLIRHAPGAGDAILAALPALARQQDRRFMVNAAPYTETFTNALRAANIAAAVAAVLGSLALLLACVGIYGVAAYNVSQRTREIGVRMALGARPSRILSMILRQNLRTVAAGVVVGVAGAIGFAQLLKSILYGLAPTDPVALAATLVILAATAVLATWAPAQRAAAIDPSVTLREE
jgi:predicted permease